MIRFVYIGSQITYEPDERQFAFYDIVRGSFLIFYNLQVFTLKEFNEIGENLKYMEPFEKKTYHCCLGLIPDWYRQNQAWTDASPT